MTEKVSEHVLMDYPKIPDSYFNAQLVDDFRLPWKDEGSATNLINIDEDEQFSEPIKNSSDSYFCQFL